MLISSYTFEFLYNKKPYEKAHKTFNFKVIKFIIGYAASVDKGLGFSNAKYNVLTVCKDDKNADETANQSATCHMTSEIVEA